MNVHLVLQLHNISGNMSSSTQLTPGWARVFVPNDMQEAVALAHLSVATGSGDDDEEVSIPWPTVSDGMPRLLPVPSGWWETPAGTQRARSARRKEARPPRRFVREILTCWGLEALADDAEMIVDELVVNAVLHGTRAALPRPSPGAGLTVLRLCMLS